MPCGTTQDGWVTVKSSEKRDSLKKEWQTNPVYLPCEPHELYKRVGIRVGILPNMGSGNWPVWTWRLMATVAVGLGQLQRFLSCDPRTQLHTCDLGIGLHNNQFKIILMPERYILGWHILLPFKILLCFYCNKSQKVLLSNTSS